MIPYDYYSDIPPIIIASNVISTNFNSIEPYCKTHHHLSPKGQPTIPFLQNSYTHTYTYRYQLYLLFHYHGCTTSQINHNISHPPIYPPIHPFHSIHQSTHDLLIRISRIGITDDTPSKKRSNRKSSQNGNGQNSRRSKKSTQSLTHKSRRINSNSSDHI